MQHQYEDTWMLDDWPLFGGQLLTGHDAPSADDSDVLDLRQDDLKVNSPVGVYEKSLSSSPGSFWSNNVPTVSGIKNGCGRFDTADLLYEPCEARPPASPELSVSVASPPVAPQPWISYHVPQTVHHTFPTVLVVPPETFELGDVSVPDIDYGHVSDQVSSTLVDAIEELFSDILDDSDLNGFVDPSPELFAFEDILSNISPEEVDSLFETHPPSPSFGFEVIPDRTSIFEEAYPKSDSHAQSFGFKNGSRFEVDPDKKFVFEDAYTVSDSSAPSFGLRIGSPCDKKALFEDAYPISDCDTPSLGFENGATLFIYGKSPTSFDVTPAENPLFDDTYLMSDPHTFGLEIEDAVTVELDASPDQKDILEDTYPMSATSSGSGGGSFDGSSVIDDTESIGKSSLKMKPSRRNGGGTSRTEPYGVPTAAANELPKLERRQRKKEQNKSAALRYRQKKREEQGTVHTEYDVLERRNIELKTKVEEIAKEISYLKGLMTELNIQLPF